MNKQQENIIVTVYVILYIIGLTFYYFNTLFFAYTFLSLAGIMIYKRADQPEAPSCEPHDSKRCELPHDL